MLSDQKITAFSTLIDRIGMLHRVCPRHRSLSGLLSIVAVALVAFLAIVQPADAITASWNSGTATGGSGTYSTGANWSGGAAPVNAGDIAFITNDIALANRTVTIGAGFAISELTAYSRANNALLRVITLTNGLTAQFTGTTVLGSNTLFNIGNNTSGGSTLSNNTLYLQDNAQITLLGNSIANLSTLTVAGVFTNTTTSIIDSASGIGRLLFTSTSNIATNQGTISFVTASAATGQTNLVLQVGDGTTQNTFYNKGTVNLGITGAATARNAMFSNQFVNAGTLILTNNSSANGGTYSFIVTGISGTSLTNDIGGTIRSVADGAGTGVRNVMTLIAGGLVNKGTLTFVQSSGNANNNNDIVISDGSAFSNALGGQLIVEAGNIGNIRVFANQAVNFGTNLLNAGTLTYLNAAGAANSGILENSGVVIFNGGILAGLASWTNTSIGTIKINLAGQLVTNAVSLTSFGTIDGGAGRLINTSANLDLRGGNVLGVISNAAAGTIRATNGNVNVAAGAVIINSGNLNLRSDGALGTVAGQGIVSNSATIAAVAGGNIGSAVANFSGGTIQATSGVLQVSGDMANAGLVNIGTATTGATLSNNNLYLVGSGQITFTNASGTAVNTLIVAGMFTNTTSSVINMSGATAGGGVLMKFLDSTKIVTNSGTMSFQIVGAAGASVTVQVGSDATAGTFVNSGTLLAILGGNSTGRNFTFSNLLVNAGTFVITNTSSSSSGTLSFTVTKDVTNQLSSTVKMFLSGGGNSTLTLSTGNYINLGTNIFTSTVGTGGNAINLNTTGALFSNASSGVILLTDNVGTNRLLIGASGAGNGNVVNAGTISIGGGTLLIQASDGTDRGLRNAGTIEFSGGNLQAGSGITNVSDGFIRTISGTGTLVSQVINQSGATLVASNGSTMVLLSAPVQQGTVAVSNLASLVVGVASNIDWTSTGTNYLSGGTIYSGNLTNSGPTGLIQGYGTNSGSVVNSGSILANKGTLWTSLGSFTNDAVATLGTLSTNAVLDLQVPNGGTLQPMINLGSITMAGGTLQFNGNAPFNVGTITNRTTGTIIGVGNIVPTVINQSGGTIIAANPVSGLNVFSVALSDLNGGTIGASNGAVLNVVLGGGAGSSFNNNGTIAMIGGTLVISNAVPGVITNNSGAFIRGLGTITPVIANLTGGTIRGSNGVLSVGLLNNLNQGTLSNATTTATLSVTNSIVVNQGKIFLSGGALELTGSGGVITNQASVFGPGILASSLYNDSAGTITATNGTLNIATNATVSFRNLGVINITSDGTNNVAHDWVNANGTVNLLGGVLTGGVLTNQGTVVGAGTISNDGLVNMLNGMVNLSAGNTLRVVPDWLNTNGVVNFTGGVLAGGAVTNTAGGLITGFGTISNQVYITASGLLMPTNGTLTLAKAPVQLGTVIITNAGTLNVQVAWQNAGSVKMLGGTIIGGSITNNSVLSGFGTVTPQLVNNSGAVLTASGGSLTLAQAPTQNGTVVVTNGGTLNVEVAWRNAGMVSILGGTVINGTVTNASGARITGNGTLTQLVVNNAGATLTASGGSLTLALAPEQSGTIVATNGGTLNVQAAWQNAGTIDVLGGTVVNGTLTNLSGARIAGFGTITSSIINSGTGLATSVSAPLHLTGSMVFNQTNGVFGASNGRLIVDTVFTNAGTVSFINSVGTFASAVVNQGAWIMDPSANTFYGDYTVASNGFITMTSGDVSIFKSNFVNQSRNSNSFNTASGKFLFDGDGGYTQVFSVAGLNLGGYASSLQLSNETSQTNGFLFGKADPMFGYSNNFAVGTLQIGTLSATSTLMLVDAFLPGSSTYSNDDVVAGLYVRDLTLGAGSLLIISNNVQLYFLRTNGVTGISFGTLNPGDNVLILGSGSFHQLAVVPEPSILMLLTLGGIAIVRQRRRNAARGQKT